VVTYLFYTMKHFDFDVVDEETVRKHFPFEVSNKMFMSMILFLPWNGLRSVINMSMMSFI